MPEDAVTDLTEMLAVHDCLRHEFARMPLTVKAVPEGDSARALALGEHILLMMSVLQAHDEGEDLLIWSLLSERNPEQAALVATMAGEHEELLVDMAIIRDEVAAWIANPSIMERSALHTTLIRLEKELLRHLAIEEQQVAPLIMSHLTQDEIAAAGAHTLASLTPEQVSVAIGLILKNTSAERGAAILQGLPAGTLATFEESGRAVYAAYAERLSDY